MPADWHLKFQISYIEGAGNLEGSLAGELKQMIITASLAAGTVTMRIFAWT